MALPTAAEITNLYLYGQKTTPTPAELVSDKWIRPADLDPKDLKSVDVNTSEFMSDTGPGRFALGRSFALVNLFFTADSSKLPPPNTPEKLFYTKKEIANHFGFTKPTDYYGFIMEQHKYDDYKPDYAERGYIYNTQEFMIRDDAKFIVKANGEQYIDDFAVVPRVYQYDPNKKTADGKPIEQRENFDFANKSGLSGYANPILEDAIDPSRIGRKVIINFIGADDVPRKI